MTKVLNIQHTLLGWQFCFAMCARLCNELVKAVKEECFLFLTGKPFIQEGSPKYLQYPLFIYQTQGVRMGR